MTKRKQFNPYGPSYFQRIRQTARAALAVAVSVGRCPDCGTPLTRNGNALDCPHCDGVRVLKAKMKVVSNG